MNFLSKNMFFTKNDKNYWALRGGVPPLSITFTRGKARLCTHIRCGGAQRRFPTSADTPLTVRFTAIVSKFFNFFFYQTLPHLIYSLFRVDKLINNVSERSAASDNANRHRHLAGANRLRRHSAAGGNLICLTFTAACNIIISDKIS